LLALPMALAVADRGRGSIRSLVDELGSPRCRDVHPLGMVDVPNRREPDPAFAQSDEIMAYRVVAGRWLQRRGARRWFDRGFRGASAIRDRERSGTGCGDPGCEPA